MKTGRVLFAVAGICIVGGLGCARMFWRTGDVGARLRWAAGHGDIRLVKALVQNTDVDIDIRDPLGLTALMHAANCGDLHVARYLLEHGADVNARDNIGLTALMRAVDPDLVELLVDQGAELDARDKRGRTALMWNAHEGRLDVVDLLLERGANPALRDEGGQTARTWAEQNGHGEIVQRLRKARAK